jgi:hypothetical protein
MIAGNCCEIDLDEMRRPAYGRLGEDRSRGCIGP